MHFSDEQCDSNKYGKEEGYSMSNSAPRQKGSLIKAPGKSVSCCACASISTEAALAFPVFFLACVLLAIILEMTAIDLRVRSGVLAAVRESAAEQIENPSFDPGKLSAEATREAGLNELDNSLLEDALSFEGTETDAVTGIGVIRWKYRIKLPFPLFSVSGGEHRGSVRVKAWNGYHGDGHEAEQEETVYVTPYGIVYHKDPGCTHLSLSVTSVSASHIGDYRNQDGGRYYACAHCARLAQGYQTVYIAREGNRFHTDRQCSGLKRSVEAIPLSQAGGRRPCSRCSN